MKSLKLITFILFIILLPCIVWYCTYQRNKNIELVNYWLGRTITIPDSLDNILTGKRIDISNNDYIIIRYVDSISCTSCKMRTEQWNHLSYSLDTIPDISYDILTIVAPKEDILIKPALKRHRYNHPVVIDSGNRISNTNHLTSNSINTFLLNQERKVIAIGDPTVNSSVFELFKKHIQS